ncbi:MAG: ABC transporter permease subunit [Planctomycetes bacterium]|nr:ABC transporter permease subunit [Planctomycetota bacterium]
MISYIVRRLLWLVPVLWIIGTLAFVLPRAVPGGPFSSEKEMPPEIEKNLQRKYHLDQPLLLNTKQLRQWHVIRTFTETQYFIYMKSLLHGDLGPSFKYKDRSVNEILAQSLPISMALGTLAMTFALIVGMSAGVVAAVRRNSWIDYSVMSLAMTGVCIPNFVLGVLLLMLFSFHLKWLPVAGWGGVRYMLMPALVLGAPYAAYIARLTRGSMLEVINQDYIRTAKAKGLSGRTIVLRHALRNGMVPVVAFLGPAMAGILTGSLVVEKIFAIPGMGSHFVNGALNRDYTLVMGTVLTYSLLLILFNLASDVAQTFLDPRVKLE